MRKNPFHLQRVEPWPGITPLQWQDWRWQMRQALKTPADFAQHFSLSAQEERAFAGSQSLFRVQTTPYYAQLANRTDPQCPIRQMILPQEKELATGSQQMADPLGENQARNRPCQRLIHRYTDRALFLATDLCGIYCRYCTRKHFTASDQVAASPAQLQEVLSYLKAHPEIKEVIFSGGDPLTLSNQKLATYMEAIDQVASVELIRIGSRMLASCPMRVDRELVDLLHAFRPVYLMVHFNHPDEITLDVAEALETVVDRGIPVFNQLVLLNGINNHPALIYALNRRLLSLRVKPYYMFQADPSLGTDHLRTSIEESLAIQKALWGHSSGLSMPTYIVDIPNGGGKVALNPDFQIDKRENVRSYRGWDGVEADYISPPASQSIQPQLAPSYLEEWLRHSP